MSAASGTLPAEHQSPDPAATARTAAPRGPAARTRALFGRYAPAVGLYGAVKLIGLYAFLRLLAYAGDYRRNDPRFGGGAHPWDVLGSWDGRWYEQVAAHGYHPQLIPIPGGGIFTMEQNSAAFFPLYPALMRIVAECTGLGLYGAGITVSVLASLVTAAGIFAVTERLGGRRAGLIAAALWAVFPGSGVEWAVYSDSLFTALAVWACYLVMTRRWIGAGLVTLFAGLNRPTAAALIAAVGIAAVVALFRRTDGIRRPLTAIVLAPLGLLGYLCWVDWKLGSWHGYSDLQRYAWAHSVDYGGNAFHAVRDLLLGRSTYLFPYPSEDMVGLAVLLLLPALTLLMLRLRPPAVLTVYTLTTIALILASQQMFGTISRFLLPAFPLLIPLALALRRVTWPMLAALLVPMALASGWYAGYALFALGIP